MLLPDWAVKNNILKHIKCKWGNPNTHWRVKEINDDLIRIVLIKPDKQSTIHLWHEYHGTDWFSDDFIKIQDHKCKHNKYARRRDNDNEPVELTAELE